MIDVGSTRIKEVGPMSVTRQVTHRFPTSDQRLAAHRLLIDPACFSDVGSMSEKHIGLTSKTNVGPTRIKEVGPTSVTRQVTHQCPTSDRRLAAHRLLIDPACFSDVGSMSENTSD